MTSFMIPIIGLGLICLFGYKLCKILLPESGFVEKFSLGFILGWGIFTVIWFLLNWIGIPYNLFTGCCVLVVLIFVTQLVNKAIGIKKRGIDSSVSILSYFRNLTGIEKILIAIIIFLCCSALIQTIYWPVRYWDSLVLYDFRAKVFAETGFMHTAMARGYFFEYPLFTSLVHTWVYILGIANPNFFYALVYIFFLGTFFENIKKFNLGRPLTLFLTMLLATAPRLFDHTQWAYTNLPFSIFITLGSVYLFWGIKNGKLGPFIVSSLLIGLSSWTRTTEPFWISCFIVAVLASLRQKKWLWPFVYGGIVASIMLPWRYFRAIHEFKAVNIPKEIFVASSSAFKNFSQLSIIQSVSDYLVTNIIYTYLGYFIIFGLVLIAKIVIKSKNWIIVLLVLLDLGIAFAGTLVFATTFNYWRGIPDSVTRMVMFVPPLVIFLIGELLSEFKRSRSNQHGH